MPLIWWHGAAITHFIQ